MSHLPPEQPHPAYDPDGLPPAPAHPRRSNLPLDALAWKRARADYAAGFSTAVIAERYGVDERTVRRHVVAEGWRHDRPEALRGLRTLPPEDADVADLPALMAGDPPDPDDLLADDPDLRLFVAAHTHEVSQLLLRPAPERFSRFAFRRASEAAAQDRPAEASSWMRLVKDIARTEDHMLRAARPFASADWMRARLAADIREQAGIEPGQDGHDFERADNGAHWRGKPAAAAAAGVGAESASPDAR